MQVSIIAPVDPLVERPGGTRTYVMNLVKGLETSGIGFSLIGVDYDETDGSPDFDFIPAVAAPNVSSVRYLRGLMKIAKKTAFSPDTIIHAQRPDYLFPFIFRKHSNKKICTLHGQMLRSIRVRRGGFYGTAYKLLESYAMKGTDRVISVDRSTQELFGAKYPYLNERSSVIPIGIRLEQWGTNERAALREKLGIPSQTKTMLYVGRLEKEKNVDLIIESLPIVEEEIQGCSLIIIGDGTQRDRLDAISKQAGTGAVQFMESQPHDVVRDYMAAADVFCLASSFESGPLVVLEALASGTPVVSTDVGQVRRFIGETTACRIVSRNKEEMAKAILDIFRLEREDVAVKCAARASEFSFGKTFDKTLEIYEDLSPPSE
jgi:glycosyltransferase involved in cell wall biosynthesis